MDRTSQSFREIDPAILAECRHRLSGLSVERDHLREGSEDHDALVVAIAPVSNAAMQPAEIWRNAKAVLVDLWIVHPFGHAGGGIDRGDLRQRGGGVEHPANHQRRRFVRNAGTCAGGLLDGHVGRLPAPGDMQVLGVGAVDLRQRRVACSGVGAGISGPFALREGLGGFGNRRGSAGREVRPAMLTARERCRFLLRASA